MQPMYVGRDERRTFTVEELYRMVDAGIVARDEPVELLGGELHRMSPQGPEHRALTVMIRDRLIRTLGPEFHVQDHSPILLDDRNLPEPDIAVVAGPAAAYLDRLPTGADVPLVVEIAVTSQPRDRDKAQLYASAGVREYWLLDIKARTLTIHRRPGAGAYEDVSILGEADELVPLHGSERWRVAEMLP